MIVGNFNFESITIPPYEAYPILVIDPYAVLAVTAPLQLFQTIAGEN
jgi:hypothetical protein